MQLAFKNIRYEILFLPILAMFFYRKSDRELLANIKTVREYCLGLLNYRKKTLDTKEEKGDLLTIML